MVERPHVICEYDNYELPPAPKVVTPEMRKRKEEILRELDKRVAEANARIAAEKSLKHDNI